jgi:hypothetical protein
LLMAMVLAAQANPGKSIEPIGLLPVFRTPG